MSTRRRPQASPRRLTTTVARAGEPDADQQPDLRGGEPDLRKMDRDCHADEGDRRRADESGGTNQQCVASARQRLHGGLICLTPEAKDQPLQRARSPEAIIPPRLALAAAFRPSALGLDVSRDGRFAVVERNHPETGISQLWSIDLGRGVFTRINPGEASDVAPALADDGRVAFTLVSPGSTNLGDLYRRAINGSGEPELLYQSPTMKHPNDWSPDGRFLIFDDHHPTQRQDLWLLPMDGARQPQPLLVTPADETLAHFSPDGQWIVYRSDESGRSEIYLRDFAPERSPAVGDQKWTLSRDGGDKPRWSADGKAVFYIAPNRMITRVPLVFNGRTVQLGVPVPLFEVNPMGWRPYDVTPDHRFLVTSVADQEGQPEPINIVLNWQRLLSRQ